MLLKLLESFSPLLPFVLFQLADSPIPSHRAIMLTQVVYLSEELNANLRERWTGSVPTPSEPSPVTPTPRPRLILNQHIREYVQAASKPVTTGSWLSRREIPTSAEILGKADDVDNDNGYDDDELEVPVNVIRGPWASKEDYLSGHYELLREDAVAPLRDAVAEVKEVPNMIDNQAICIYENVWRVILFI